METNDYSEVRDEVLRRARKLVWCSVATIDRVGRPRSRILHVVWEGPHGWVGTYPTSHKAKHLRTTPFVSCGYVDVLEPMYIDAATRWVDDLTTKERVWELMKSYPEPYGFDPATIWKDGPQGTDFGLLRLDPWRIELYTASPGNQPATTIWRPS